MLWKNEWLARMNGWYGAYVHYIFFVQIESRGSRLEEQVQQDADGVEPAQGPVQGHGDQGG